MYKKCVLTDTHNGLFKDSDVWQKVTMNLFDHLIETCKSNNIDTIYHLGDWFENRKSINTVTINTSIKIAKKLSDFNVYIIVGNHDSYYQNKILPSSLKIFNKFNNIHIISEPTRINDDILFPWIVSEEEIQNNDGKICYGHFSIIDFHMNKTYINSSGLKPSLFKKFEKVFSGHFHLRSQKNNIMYIGCPYQQTFDDYKEEKGYYIIDDNGEYEFIFFNDYPHFTKLYVNESTTSFDEKSVKGNIVRLIFQEELGTKKTEDVINSILEMGPVQLNTFFVKTDEYKVESEMEESDFIFDEYEMMKNYIDVLKTPQHINKKTLNSMVTKLLKELNDKN